MITYFYYPYSVQNPILPSSTIDLDGFRILNVTNELDGTFYQDNQAISGYSTLSETGLHFVANKIFGGIEYFRNITVSGTPIPFEYELSATSSNLLYKVKLDNSL